MFLDRGMETDAANLLIIILHEALEKLGTHFSAGSHSISLQVLTSCSRWLWWLLFVALGGLYRVLQNPCNTALDLRAQ